MKAAKRAGALILALVMALSVGACGYAKRTPEEMKAVEAQKAREEAAGAYSLFAVETYGYVAEKAAFNMESELTLEADGTGYMTINEDGGEVSDWSLAGEGIIVTSGVSTMDGKYKDGVIRLKMDGGNVLYYAKDGADTSGYDVMTADEFLASGGAAKVLQYYGEQYYYGLDADGYDPEKAEEYFTSAAEMGGADAWYYLGKLKEFSIEKDHAKVMLEDFNKAAELGSPLGLYGQGRTYMLGKGVTADYDKAQSCFQQAIAMDFKDANKGLGDMYMYGYGVTPDAQQAYTYYTAATEGSNFGIVHAAEVEIGNLYYHGMLDAEPDYTQAMEWYQKAIDSGSSEGYYAMGWAYAEGAGVEQDYTQAMQYFEQAAALGDCSAMCAIGNLYYNGGGVEKDPAKALEWYEKAARAGDATACSNAAGMYQVGDGVKQDPEKAAQWYLKAAQEGDTEVYADIGDIYHFEQYGVVDEAKALKYYKKGEKAGSAYATARVGSFYYWGYGGTEIKYKKALKKFKKAANSGESIGQYYTGLAYYQGNGVKQSYKNSLKWFKKSAKQGDGMSMAWIGYQYYQGLGVKKSNKKAKEWMNKALDTKQLTKEDTKQVKDWLKDIKKKKKKK